MANNYNHKSKFGWQAITHESIEFELISSLTHHLISVHSQPKLVIIAHDREAFINRFDFIVNEFTYSKKSLIFFYNYIYISKRMNDKMDCLLYITHLYFIFLILLTILSFLLITVKISTNCLSLKFFFCWNIFCF